MAEVKWTEEQLNAITYDGTNLLVSASAGSGKTAVMVERIINFATTKKVDVDKFLVVTFVSSAAAEMKWRLHTALTKKLASEANEENRQFLIRQIDKVDNASICTIDSFCNSLLSKYFYIVGVNPKATLITNKDKSIAQEIALTNVLAKFTKQNDVIFDELKECFSNRGNDNALREVVLKLFEFAITFAKPKKFIDDIFMTSYLNPEEVYKIANSHIVLGANDFIDYASKVRDHLLTIPNFEKAVEIINTRIMNIISIKLENSTEQNSEILFGKYKNGSFTKPKNADFIQDEATELYKTVGKRFKALKYKLDFLRKENLISEKANLKISLARVEKLREVLVAFMCEYSSYKKKNNFLDFMDIEHYALNILDDKIALQEIRACYDYVFVDEYQDVNDVQETILRNVSNGNNMFMVGDLKQSIYGFRLCDPSIFIGKYNKYHDNVSGKNIVFKDNFRSDSSILAFADKIFSLIMLKDFGGIEYRQDSLFKAGATYLRKGNLPIVSVHAIKKESEEKKDYDRGELYKIKDENNDDEADFARMEALIIANKIKQFMEGEIYDAKNEEFRQTEYSDIAILVRAFNDSARQIQDNLIAMGFPVVSTAGTVQGVEINLLADFLKVIDNFKNDVPLIAVLKSVFYGLTENELAKIRIEFNENVENGKNLNFYNAVVFSEQNSTDENIKQKLRFFFEDIAKQRTRIYFKGIAKTLQEKICDSGYDLQILTRQDGQKRALQLNNFINNINASIYNFDLAKYVENEKIAKVDEDLGDDTVVLEKSITMMSMHKSKGLEFPIVFVANTGGNFNVQDLKKAMIVDKELGVVIDGYDLKNRTKRISVIKKCLAIKKRYELIQEEIRLLYVALTRAKNHMVITGKFENVSACNNKYTLADCNNFMELMAKEFCLSGVFDNCGKNSLHNGYVLEKYQITDLSKMSFENINQQSAEQCLSDLTKVEHFEKLLKASLNYNIENTEQNKAQHFSATQIAYGEVSNKEQASGISVEEKDKKIAMDLGVAYHNIFENIDFEKYDDERVDLIVKNLQNKKFILSSDMIDKSLIKAFFESDFAKSLRGKKLFKEFPFAVMLKNENGKDEYVSGVIDLVVVDDNHITVLDFKTASVKTAEKAKALYGVQLDIYSKAIEKLLNKTVSDRVIYSIYEKKAIFC